MLRKEVLLIKETKIPASIKFASSKENKELYNKFK
jgi:hypothetical protein